MNTLEIEHAFTTTRPASQATNENQATFVQSTGDDLGVQSIEREKVPNQTALLHRQINLAVI